MGVLLLVSLRFFLFFFWIENIIEIINLIEFEGFNINFNGNSLTATQGVSVWSVGVAVGLSCLIGFVVGLALRPYISFIHVSVSFLCYSSKV